MTLTQQAAQFAHKGGTTIAAGGGIWVWLAENQQPIATLGIIVGILLGVAGFVVNWVYQHKRSKGPPA